MKRGMRRWQAVVLYIMAVSIIAVAVACARQPPGAELYVVVREGNKKP